MKVLIGYDGSMGADAALADLRRTGLPSDTEALVASVGEFWLPPPSSYGMSDTGFASGTSRIMRDAEDLAVAGRDKVLAAYPEWATLHEARVGSPARQLLELAGEWKPDLLVVGSHGRTGLAKFFLGSVSQKLASEAPCSVRIARGRIDGAEGPVRIVVGIDGSRGAEAAVGAVANRAWPEGSHARLVTAIGPFSIDGQELKGELERVQELHSSALQRFRSKGLEVTTTIHEADPRKLIVEIAEQWGADCIFVGASGLLTIDRFLFGTVAAAVTARANCSVEVVRARIPGVHF